MPILGGIVFLTGAASGIGHATALAYARAGVEGLYIADINEKGMKDIEPEIIAAATHPEFKLKSAYLDVAKEEEVERVIGDVKVTFGRLDFAANIAGVAERIQTPLADTATDTYREVLGVNMDGVFYCLKAEIKIMREQDPKSWLPGKKPTRGSIINISSIASEKIVPGLCSYGISKHAVAGLTRNAAFNHTRDRIRVNSIAPGFVFTGMSYPIQVVTDWIEASTPMGRYGKTEEIADIVVYLSGPKTAAITGQTWFADGGFSIVSKGDNDTMGSFVAPYIYPAYAPQR